MVDFVLCVYSCVRREQADDKEYILELNDTAIGLATVCEAEDLRNMAALVVVRVGEALCPAAVGGAASRE